MSGELSREAASLTPELAASIESLLDEAGVTANRSLVRRLLSTSVLLGMDDTERLDRRSRRPRSTRCTTRSGSSPRSRRCRR